MTWQSQFVLVFSRSHYVRPLHARACCPGIDDRCLSKSDPLSNLLDIHSNDISLANFYSVEVVKLEGHANVRALVKAKDCRATHVVYESAQGTCVNRC